MKKIERYGKQRDGQVTRIFRFTGGAKGMPIKG